MTTNDPIAPHPGDHSPLTEQLTAKVARHISESGHWYDRSAQLIESVPSADGKKLVKCTLVHARKLDLARGITSIIGLADKPALTNWKIDQAILSALTLPRSVSQTEAEWLSLVKEEAKLKAAEAAEEGTRIHAAIQSHFQSQPYDAVYQPHINGVLSRLPQDGGAWVSEVGVAHPLGYGTKIDLLNDRYLLDIKGKDGNQAALDEMETYDEHAMQLMAGRQAAIEGIASSVPIYACERDCGIVFVSRTHPGACSIKWIEEKKLLRAWEMFQGLLSYCHAKDVHRPFQGAKR